jgi:hypothetical protein
MIRGPRPKLSREAGAVSIPGLIRMHPDLHANGLRDLADAEAFIVGKANRIAADVAILGVARGFGQHIDY